MIEALQQIIQCLKAYKPILEAEPPQTTGFYAVFVISNDCFNNTDLSQIKKGDCIYIGIAENETLFERVAESHLKNTGRSTLRRSMGGVLRTKLDLKPIKRGITTTINNISNYTFSPESEQRLTDFMYTHLGLAFFPYNNLDCSFEAIEKKLIEEFGFPIFNIEYAGSRNPYKRIIKELRKECRSIVAREI